MLINFAAMNILRKIFQKKPQFPPADMSVLKTDIHSHLIPGIDDGAKTMDDSLNLIRAFKELGYKKLITTPHIMSDQYRNNPEIILDGLERVRAELKNQQVEMELDAAAEYYIDHEFLKLIEEKRLLTFGNKYVLVEMSFFSETPMLKDALFNLQVAGYRPVLAHAERYSFWHKNYEKFEDMKARGALLQLNIGSLTGYYSPETKKIAERLIDDGMYDLIGSDCHHAGHLELIKDCLKEEYLHKILASGKLLNSTL